MVLKPLSMKFPFLRFYVDVERITIKITKIAMFETQINLNKGTLIKSDFTVFK